MELEVVIEIPKGSRNKYEADPRTGHIWLDRMLFTATRYPSDYGYVPDTLAEDGDPLDVLVLLDDPTFPGCHIMVRPIGVFRMEDEEGIDDKVLCVPATDPRYAGVTTLSDLESFSPLLLEEISHFFHVYKDMEPGKHSVVGGWEGPESAQRIIESARRRLAERAS